MTITVKTSATIRVVLRLNTRRYSIKILILVNVRAILYEIMLAKRNYINCQFAGIFQCTQFGAIWFINPERLHDCLKINTLDSDL